MKSLYANGRKEMKKPTVAFRSFSKVPSNEVLYISKLAAGIFQHA
jgi:hypothetical protein